MARRRRAKRVERKLTIREALDEWQSEVGSLKEEMEEWQGNLESANMEHLPKYEEVGQAVETLEAADAESRFDELCSSVGELKLLDAEITIAEWHPYGKRSMSRSTRLSNALAAAQEAASALRTALEDPALKPPDDDLQEIESALEELEEGLSECENVEFPGMY